MIKLRSSGSATRFARVCHQLRGRHVGNVKYLDANFAGRDSVIDLVTRVRGGDDDALGARPFSSLLADSRITRCKLLHPIVL